MDAKLAQATDFIQTALPDYLGADIVFTRINADTFFDDNDEEMNVIFVSFKTDQRPLDPRRLIDFHSETWGHFLDMGFSTPPVISYDDQPLTVS